MLSPFNASELRWWQLAIPAAAVLIAAGTIVVLTLDVNQNERAIKNRPTNEKIAELRYANVVQTARQNRRICRQLNSLRRNLLLVVTLGGRPSASTTDYYRTHPQELARAQKGYDEMVARFASVACRTRYPIPDRSAYLGRLLREGDPG